ncbi:MAG: hypothetical protein QNM02_16890 [Acidimicrobiia bacterium]|nr:hypothetical protein [Acidimicrobiia bacterium]
MAPTRIACGVFALALVAGACASVGGSDEQPSADTSASTAAPAIDTASADEQTAPLTTEAASPATDAVVESAEPAEPAESAAVPEPTEPPAAVPVAPAALQFTAPAVGGGEIDAAAYAGTPTLFWFWAPT